MTEADRDIDLLVVGELNPDVIVLGVPPAVGFGQAETIVDGISLTVGSSSAITACGAAALGLRVAFVGTVGDDTMGRFMLESLGARGIDVSACHVVQDTPTGASVILGRGDDRAILTATGTITTLTAADVPLALVARARHLHVGSVYLQSSLRPGLADLLRAATDAGATVSIDPNWDPSGGWAPIEDLLAAADICLLNLAEARALTGQADPETAARTLSERGKAGLCVVVKLGADGALLVDRGRVVRTAAAPTVDVVDATGAGDSFDAGFIAGWSAGWAARPCLDLAVACGTASVQRTGGVDGQPTFEEARSIAATAGAELPATLASASR